MQELLGALAVQILSPACKSVFQSTNYFLRQIPTNRGDATGEPRGDLRRKLGTEEERAIGSKYRCLIFSDFGTTLQRWENFV